MATNFSLQTQFPTVGPSTNTGYSNNSLVDADSHISYNLTAISIDIIIALICLFGSVGNGIVIWLLGFRIKRNPFSTYVLNLAVADFGYLISILLVRILLRYIFERSTLPPVLQIILINLIPFMYNAGQFLLSVISVDRCVAVFCPIWHRCHRPSYLSATICALVWLFLFLFGVLHFIFLYKTEYPRNFHLWYFFLTTLPCLLCMIVTTLTLFIKVCFKSHLRKRRKLFRVILLTLFCFLILSCPINGITITMYYFSYNEFKHLAPYGVLCACLNSSVNPLIYFLGGRQKRGQTRESMKVILQRLFKEEEDARNGLQCTAQCDTVASEQESAFSSG